MMKKVEFDEDGYPVYKEDDKHPEDEKFTEEDYAFLEEFREMMREFQ